MKAIKITMMMLVCILCTNMAMANSPEEKKNDKEKSELLNKIRKTVSVLSFTDYVKTGESAQIVLRCTINDENEVVVSKVIGFNEELKAAVRKRMSKKVIKVKPGLSGEELALRLNFEKH